MKDYQQKRMRSYLMPEPVYRQAYWATRDLKRMRQELAVLAEGRDSIAVREGLRINTGYGGVIKDVTAERAVKIAQLSSRVEAIEAAFSEVPEKYRCGLWQRNVENGDYGEGAHINTWRRWQQVLMYNVAKNLQIY